jgi:hypothetical protein
MGLAKGVTLYGLRHRYGLMGIKNGVNLKLLSLCMGHVRTQRDFRRKPTLSLYPFVSFDRTPSRLLNRLPC